MVMHKFQSVIMQKASSLAFISCIRVILDHANTTRKQNETFTKAQQSFQHTTGLPLKPVAPLSIQPIRRQLHTGQPRMAMTSSG